MYSCGGVLSALAKIGKTIAKTDATINIGKSILDNFIKKSPLPKAIIKNTKVFSCSGKFGLFGSLTP
jgi:hypothetical protein